MTVFDQIVAKKATENYKNSPEKAHADMCDEDIDESLLEDDLK